MRRYTTRARTNTRYVYANIIPHLVQFVGPYSPTIRCFASGLKSCPTTQASRKGADSFAWDGMGGTKWNGEQSQAKDNALQK